MSIYENIIQKYQVVGREQSEIGGGNRSLWRRMKHKVPATEAGWGREGNWGQGGKPGTLVEGSRNFLYARNFLSCLKLNHE